MACFLIWVEADMAVFTANQKHQKNSSNRVFMIYALLSIIYFYKPLKKKKHVSPWQDTQSRIYALWSRS